MKELPRRRALPSEVTSPEEAPPPRDEEDARAASGEVAAALAASEQRAAHALRRYRELADMLPAIIAETDAEGRLTFVNRFGCELLGYRADEWLGQSVVEFLAPDDRLRAAANLARRMAGVDLPPNQYTVLHKDGHRIPVDLRAVNVVDDGVVVGARCVLVDLRERLAAERERLAYEQRTLDARRLESLGVLAGGVAHDFNNLLAVVLGNTELALLELPPEASARRFVEDIRVASRRAADLTRQLLAYTGKTPFQRTDVDLSQLVRAVLGPLEVSVTRRAHLEAALAPDLPAVRGDETLLRQVIANLVTNGCEALPPTGGKVAIRTEAATVRPGSPAPAGLVQPAQLEPGDYVVLRVSDSGAGMDAETRLRIFEPFFTTKFTGRGLGLPVVLGVVRAHGGGIAVVSEPGRGAGFEVYLPAVVADRHDVPTTRGDTSRPRLEPLLGRILIIDPEPDASGMAARLLRRLGLEVATAATEPDALARFAETPGSFDLVLLDASPPATDGVATLRRLRAMRPTVRIVLSGTDGERQARDRFAGEVVCGFLQKPLDLQATVAVLRALLDPRP